MPSKWSGKLSFRPARSLPLSVRTLRKSPYLPFSWSAASSKPLNGDVGIDGLHRALAAIDVGELHPFVLADVPLDLRLAHVGGVENLGEKILKSVA